MEKLTKAVALAKDKLARIIAREGTAHGARLSGDYFALLVAEEIAAMELSAHCEARYIGAKKERTADAVRPN